MIRTLSIPLLLLLAATAARAADGEGPAVVPQGERDAAAAKAADGPTKNEGIAGVDQLVVIDLAQEFPELKGRQLRARAITIAPGGHVAVHEHQQRPGFAYILEGEVVEHRQGKEPQTYGVGKVALEGTGVVHWWENTGKVPVRALVVDIVPNPTPAPPAK